MAATPPLQIAASPQTPLTPLHGAAYDRLDRQPTRHSARISQRTASRELHSTPEPAYRASKTLRKATPPASSRRATQKSLPQSPELTPKSRSTQRVQILSPPSPETESSAPKPVNSSVSQLQPFLSSSTTMSEAMLPTPVKTPKKKTIPKVNSTGRALFQETALTQDEISHTPRRSRKGKRFNGFSLESFSVEEGETNGRVQVFTDSRDKVPQADTSESNPFIDRPVDNGSASRQVARSSKRRKISGPRTVDAQVSEAIQQDEGMVYVFRGKKVYRRFDDSADEEEDIDGADLGLLENAPDGTKIVKPLKTLTRRSVRPKRLFQTSEDKIAQELEKEEEAMTDIEEPVSFANTDEPVEVTVPQVDTTTNGDGEINPRSLRSTTKAAIGDEKNGESRHEKPKKASPFDTWPRVKAGSREGNNPRSKKRVASEALDSPGDLVAVQKRTRS